MKPVETVEFETFLYVSLHIMSVSKIKAKLQH